MKHLKPLLAALLLAALITTGVGLGSHAARATSTITPIAGKTYTLYAGGVSSSATSITLTSFAYPATTTKVTTADLGTTAYLTLEPGNPDRQEIVSFTGVTQNADGTATLTGVTRGLEPFYPYTSDSTLKKQHAGGTQAVLSNPPQLYNDIITYINAVAFSGAPDATSVLKGVVELATAAEQAASTASGSSGPLALAASNATSTYNSATAANRVVVTGAGGKIDTNFLDLSTIGSSLTLASSTTIGDFPAFSIGKHVQVFTTTGTSTFTVPSGVTSFYVEVQGAGAAGGTVGGGASSNETANGGGGGGYANKIVDLTGTSSVQVYVGSSGQWSTFGTNGFYFKANPGSGATGGTGVGGDVNLQGDDGDPGTSGCASSCGSTSRTGNGGSSHMGGGGQVGSGGAGTAGHNYGGGGGGGNGSGAAGGSGGQGIVIVRW